MSTEALANLIGVLLVVAVLGYFIVKDPDSNCINTMDHGLAAKMTEQDRKHCEQVRAR